MTRWPLVALVVLLALALTSIASAAEPKLTVPKGKLAAALHCHGDLAGTKKQPIMLVTGTGATGEEAYAIGKGAFDAFGHPVCDVDFPDFTTADIQTSVQYLVYGIRQEARRAGRPIAVIGISQGGLLPRIALTYWPSLRPKVTDVLAAAGTQHGTNVGVRCSASRPCPPAGWQQAAGSDLLKALSRQPDETPGPTAWTTVRSANDETVQPQTGKHPASALKGATNILIQSVCPGRTVSHIGTALDSVAFAAFRDALSHPGPAKVSRLPEDVCSHPFAPGLDPAGTSGLVGAAGGLITDRLENKVPKFKAEPRLKAWFKQIVR